MTALYLLLGMSALAFLLMGADKVRARRGARRIRERTLWLLALLGGGPGAFLGMVFFRHKTRHTAFRIGLPLLALAEAGAAAYLCLAGTAMIK